MSRRRSSKRELVNLAGLPEDHPERKRQARNVDQILEEDYPERIRNLDRIAGQIRISRQKMRAARTQMFQALSERYTEDVLDKLSRMAANDPGVVWFLLRRQPKAGAVLRRQPKDLVKLVEMVPGLKDLVELTLALMQSRRNQSRQKKRWKPSQDEITNLVDRVAEGTSVTKARKRVAKWLDTTEGAVKKTTVPSTRRRANARKNKNK